MNSRLISDIKKEVKDDIMSTDVMVRVSDDTLLKGEIKYDVNKVFDYLRDFDNRFSRFKKDNELAKFNDNTLPVLSPELREMLEISLKYYKESQGIFNIAILDILKSEGYSVSKKSGFTDPNTEDTSTETPYLTLEDIHLDEKDTRYEKPFSLKVDLGGIGKGYAIDKVSEHLRKKYKNFIVNAGGDVRLEGSDIKANIKGWICSVEHPLITNEIICNVKLSDMSIATSGINKRKWLLKGLEKNHIIDPRTKHSVQSDLITVSVISNKTADADVLAKVILIMGMEKGLEYAEKNNIAAILVDKEINYKTSNEFQKYIYED